MLAFRSPSVDGGRSVTPNWRDNDPPVGAAGAAPDPEPLPDMIALTDIETREQQAIEAQREAERAIAHECPSHAIPRTHRLPPTPELLPPLITPTPHSPRTLSYTFCVTLPSRSLLAHGFTEMCEGVPSNVLILGI